MVPVEDFKPFDPVQSGLSGTILIEASAGTGKTHTIASLVVRLVLERDLPIEKILVVTFTEAAAAELKERVYARFSDMLAALEGRPCKEAFSLEMAGRCRNIPLARRKILAALRNFDRSLIGTIHAFCSRMLRENRFESGMRFDAELVRDAFFLFKRAAEDVWRMEVVPLEEERAGFLVRENFSPERLAKLAETCGKPGQKILPAGEEYPDALALKKAFEKKAALVRESWRENEKVLKNLLLESPALNRNILRSETLEKGFFLLEQWQAGEVYPEILLKLIPGTLERATKKGEETPSHPFFDLCGLCVEAHEKFLGASRLAQAFFCRHLIEKTRERADFLKEKNGVFTYDDLLYAVRDAVWNEAETKMTERIRSLFSAALIDEFQDTDPVQYAIFDRIFASAGLPLFLIGDPKQAIYSFRGADVFTYLAAAKKSEKRYTLAFNWRSDPELIRAVNRIFSRNRKAFLLDGLDFHPVFPAEREREIFFDREDFSSVKIWMLESASNGKPMGVESMRRRVILAVGDEIVRLVEGGRSGEVRIGERGLEPGDIAVLVRSNREARQMRESFSEHGIPAVIRTDGNVLETSEAKELTLVLQAILHVQDASLMRRALATELMAFTASEIRNLNHEEKVFSEIFSAFSTAKDLWRAKGIFPMLMNFYDQFEILPRVAAFSMGERRVTNLLHLAELLHQAEISENLDPGLLFRWFTRQCTEDFAGRVEAPLRLESDEKRVHIVTVHKAKGLEYPVVFCPFIADPIVPLDPGKNPERILFYHEEPGMELVVDLGGKEDRTREEALHTREAKAEGVRLLYVAMTRARHKVYLVWGDIKNREKSAAYWLFHGNLEKEETESPQGQSVFPKEGGEIAMAPLPMEEGRDLPPERDSGEKLERCRHKPLEPDVFRVTSFSSIVAGSAQDEARDMDGLAGGRRNREEGPEGGIFSFPAGSGPGTFMHAVFENIDFTRGRSHFLETGEKLLTAHGYDPEWAQVFSEMVTRVLDLPIGEERVSLRDIPLQDQLRELDFYLPLKSFDPAKLAGFVRSLTGELCNEIPPKLERIRFSRSEGFLRGIMDLVFRYRGKYYLVDWKSNHLGDSLGDYRPEKLAEEMARHLYILQYHLYVLALDRHLALRLADYDYERDFGGVAYIFLRGVNPEISPDCGLFQEKPPEERIRKLASLLLAEPGEGLAPTGAGRLSVQDG